PARRPREAGQGAAVQGQVGGGAVPLQQRPEQVQRVQRAVAEGVQDQGGRGAPPSSGPTGRPPGRGGRRARGGVERRRRHGGGGAAGGRTAGPREGDGSAPRIV